MNHGIRMAFLFALVATAHASFAQGARFYRCKDAKGKVHFSSSVPAECQGLDVEVLNANSTVVGVIESEQTRAKTQARQAEEAQRIKERNDQIARDRVLLETYLTVADIERLRDQRLELLQAQLQVAEQHIGTLNGRLDQLRQQTARFKPYSDAPSAPPLPDHLGEALINTVKSLEADRENIRQKKSEQSELVANFARDIKRFKELKSIQ